MTNIQKGKREILLLFSAALLLSLGIMIAYNLKIGSEKLLVQIFRTCFIITLMLLTYQGYGFAKWILSFCYVFLSLDIFLNRAHFFKNTNYFFLFMGIFYAFIPIWLIFSKNISLFLNDKKTRTIPK